MHNNGSDSIATRIYWGGGAAFDQESIDLFLRLAQDSKVIFDIGANTGIYSLLAARNNPGAEVYAFEPVPDIRGEFARSIAINGLNNLKLSDLAISSTISKSEFYVPNNFAAFPTSASLNNDFRDHSAAILVSVTTIDEFVLQNGVGRIDLMKIDTESTEHLVLAGASRTLNNDRPFIICEVLPEQDPKLLSELLAPSNYSYFRIAPDGLIQTKSPESDPRCENLNNLFVPSEQMPRLINLSLNVNLVPVNRSSVPVTAVSICLLSITSKVQLCIQRSSPVVAFSPLPLPGRTATAQTPSVPLKCHLHSEISSRDDTGIQ